MPGSMLGSKTLANFSNSVALGKPGLLLHCDDFSFLNYFLACQSTVTFSNSPGTCICGLWSSLHWSEVWEWVWLVVCLSMGPCFKMEAFPGYNPAFVPRQVGETAAIDCIKGGWSHHGVIQPLVCIRPSGSLEIGLTVSGDLSFRSAFRLGDFLLGCVGSTRGGQWLVHDCSMRPNTCPPTGQPTTVDTELKQRPSTMQLFPLKKRSN